MLETIQEVVLAKNLKIRLSVCDFIYNRLKIELVNTSSGKTIDLSSFSKEKPHIKEGDGFYYEPNIKTVNISISEIKEDPKKILIVLHEVAHSQIISQSLTPIFKYFYGFKILLNYAFSDKFLSRAKATLKEERNTWALALKFVRQLREQGFDVMSCFKDLKDFELWFKNNTGLFVDYEKRVEKLKLR